MIVSLAKPLSPRSLALLRETVRFRVSEANFSDARAECLTHISHSGYRKMPSNNVYRGHKESLSVRSSTLSFHRVSSGESAPPNTSHCAASQSSGIRRHILAKSKHAREFFFREKFTFVPLRKPELCPSIHFESRPATLVTADTVF